ncbi:MAG: hypothetical protein CL470_03180 [Acidimicrobiaceae bacterium]|nr:hypothetical protein [Acidimicrobiaceae bacterium]|tara:strand:+ start:236 stop:547 length:312 start_codon:yes stop_codon:yes gene_type:complete
MFSFRPKDPIGIRLGELKDTLLGYSKQEIRDPFVSLFKWTAYGLAGLVFVIAGLGHLSLGSLRILQTETTVFDNELSFIPYLIVFAALLLIAIVSYRAIKSQN